MNNTNQFYQWVRVYLLIMRCNLFKILNNFERLKFGYAYKLDQEENKNIIPLKLKSQNFSSDFF